MKKYSIYLLTLGILFTGCAKQHTTIEKQIKIKKNHYVSEKEINNICEATYNKILSSNKICKDDEKVNRIQNITNNILSSIENNPIKEWEIIVLERKDINAICLANGKIFINSGIFKAAKNDAQIAAILSHEISHALLSHGKAKINRSTISNQLEITGSVIAGIFNPLLIIPFLAIYEGVKHPVHEHYNKLEEREADKYSLRLMKKAGYDINEAVNLWKNMKIVNVEKSRIKSSTHLSYNERIIELNYMISQIKKRDI